MTPLFRKAAVAFVVLLGAAAILHFWRGTSTAQPTATHRRAETAAPAAAEERAPPPSAGSALPPVRPPASAPAGAPPPLDLQTASRQFREAQNCRSVSGAFADQETLIRNCQDPATDPQRIAWCAKQTAAAEAKLHDLLPRFAHCSNDADALEANYYETMTQAARLGDTRAQLCWVEGEWHHDVSDEDYRREAMSYLNAALARGDWRFVNLMATTYVDNPPRSAGLLFDAEKPADRQVDLSDFRAMSYRMSRLLRLGAEGKYADWVGMLTDRSFLSQEQIAAAETWAEQEYRDHFAAQPKLTEIPEGCYPDLSESDRQQARQPWLRVPGSDDE